MDTHQGLQNARTFISESPNSLNARSEVTCNCFFHPPAPLLSQKQWLGEAQFPCGTHTEILVTAGAPLPLQYCFRRSCAVSDLTSSNKGTTNSPTSFGILSSTWSCVLKFTLLKNEFSISQIAILLPSTVKTITF